MKGYTLIEMLITVGLATLLLLVIVESSITIARSHDRARDYLEINSAAHGAFSRFSRDIRRATSIDVVNSTLDASDGTVVLEMMEDGGTSNTTSFSLFDGKVREIYNGAIVGDITPPSVEVTNLTFRLFQVSTTTALRIEMTLSAVNFYGTYVLRGSYTE